LAYGAKANKFNREADDFAARVRNNRAAGASGSSAGSAGYRGAQGGARRPPRRGYQGDPFKDLGVSPSASAADLKKAWKRQMMQHHPDRGGNPETAKKINSAYQAILKSRGIKDSIYADGFDIDWAAIAI
jgi:DnaJ like chaperone protein